MLNQEKYANGRQFMGQIPCGGSFDGCSFNLNYRDLKKPLRQAFQVYFLQTILVFSIFFVSNNAGAADVTMTPRLSVGAAYDDNVFFSTDDKLDSSIFTISPSLDIDYETLLSTFSLKADWDILNYSEESDLNRTNQYYRLTADRIFKERWDTSAEFKYFRDTTLNTYLQETGRVIDRVGRDYFDVGGKVAYNLTLVSGISAGYRYQNASYEDDIFSEYDQHSGSLYYYHRLKNEIDKLSLGPSYSHRKNDFNERDSLSLDIGWDRDWSDIAKSGASIGARYINVKLNDGSEDDTWGVKARFDYTYQGMVSTTTFRYYHDLNTTAAGADINVDNFYLTYRRSITERFRIGIDGRLVFSYKLLDRESDINDQRYYWLEPNLSYQLTKYIGISLKYRYQNNVDFADDGDRTRERNIIWLQLNSWFPIKL